MKYLDAMLQTRRMGGFCKWCNASMELPRIADRLGVEAPWLADPRYRRAFTRHVARHLKTCKGGFQGMPRPPEYLRNG